MKSILLFILLTPTVLLAQDVNFKWAKQMVGGGDVDLGTSVAEDKHGNIYITGRFGRTVDFDPGPGVFYLTRPFIGYEDFGYDDMFVLKLDAAGNFIWAKQIAANGDFEGTEVSSIVLDTAGNIYTTGFFLGTIDFDPGPCVYNLTSTPEKAFILKLSADGDFIWVKQMTANTNSYSVANFIALDSLGNIFITGKQSTTYYISQNMVISKLDSSGNFIWTKQMEGSGENFSEGLSIAFDKAGNLFTAGRFEGMVDFDPGPGIYDLIAIGTTNSFISKLDANGDFIWAKRLTGNDTSLSWGRSINIDMFGNCIITGGFYGTIDFDPGANAFNLTSTLYGGDNFFVSKLDSAGNFIWAKRIGGTGNSNSPSNVQCASAALDTLGNIYSTGYFQQTVDFDPGTGIFNFSTGPDLTPLGFDMFISKLNPDGNFTWAKQIHSTTSYSYTGQTYPSSIKLDTYGNIYISGGFFGTTDFDPGTGNYNLSSPSGNIFVYKMDACINSTSSTLTVVDCKSYTLNGHTYTSSGVYTQTILNTSGCDSIITLNLTINRFDTTINVSTCNNNNYIHCRTYNSCTVCYTIDSSGVYTDTLATANGCDSLVHMNITIGPFRTSFYDTACNSYSWNSQTFTSSGSYTDTLVASNGCDSIVTLNLIINTVAVSAQPQSVSLCAGSNYTFSVTATGTNISYQWQLSTDGGFTFTDIAGANTSSYTVVSIIPTQNGYNYRCLLVTSGCNEVISSIAVLTVITPVVITSQPVDIEICSGNNVSFSVSGSSSQTISYQWQVSTNAGTSYFPITNNEVYSGATTPTLMITRATVSLNIHHYRCLLSSGICTVATTSNGAILTVHELPNVQLIASPFTSLLPWQSTTLSATSLASGGILSTTWLYNNAIVPNTGNTRPVNFDQIGTYQVRIQETWPSDLVCSNQSDVVAISAQTGSSLFIYPNPNDGRFKISYYNSSGVSDLEVVTVFDSKGAMVYRKRFTVTGIYTSFDIKMVHVPGAFYSVVISDAKGKRLMVGKMIAN